MNSRPNQVICVGSKSVACGPRKGASAKFAYRASSAPSLVGES